MPGLLRGVARTAVIAGTASAVNGRVQRRQADKFAERDAHAAAQRQAAYEAEAGYQQAPQQVAYQQAPPPPAYQQAPPAPAAPPPMSADERLAALERLGNLHSQGVLSDAEFDAEKSRVLSS
jgi:hypothetical protein